MKIATFNVNSIKARLESVLTWFREASPDVACLQEIKTETKSFPAAEFEAMGYNCAVFGQKTYNGVALISKHRIEDVRMGCLAMMQTSSRATSRPSSRRRLAPCASRRSTPRTATPSTARSIPTSSPGWTA
jgi:exodeoxyribonuclease III